jgi:predicted nuclease of predicted toxin-antitoxin system
MRLLIDMNLTPRWVPYLIAAGHECVHCSDEGPAGVPDAAVCIYARDHGYVFVTRDLELSQIMAVTQESKPGIILLRGEPLIPELRGIALLSAISRSEAELQNGATLTIDWTGHKEST